MASKATTVTGDEELIEAAFAKLERELEIADAHLRPTSQASSSVSWKATRCTSRAAAAEATAKRAPASSTASTEGTSLTPYL